MSRSQMIFAAVQQMPSRFQLVHQTAKGARRLHQGERMLKVRMADTLNEVLVRIAAPEKETLCQNDATQTITIFNT